MGSATRIRQLLDVPIHTFAYPYGDTDRQVIALLDAAGYRLAATVQAGGNPAFSPPFLLRRTMVYGGDDLATFGELVSSESRPITDHRSTAEYRRHAVGVLARRLVRRASSSELAA